MVSPAVLLELPEIRDARGRLTFAQDANLPFAVKRFFVLYDLAPGIERGGHAHWAQHQLLFMMSGSARITVDDGRLRQSFLLERPTTALHVPPMLWLELSEFAPGAVCAVLASNIYDESDYIRDHARFLKLVG